MNLKKVYKKIKSQASTNGLFNILYVYIYTYVSHVLFSILVKEDGESSEGSANDPEFTGIYCTIDGKHMDDLPKRKYNTFIII